MRCESDGRRLNKPVNPLKKLKLKSQLRNCDYVLAGTVIKQQYYDPTKSTVINRLIDEFMANPNFDNALKLIEYNEMLTFYFTESCAGGLYVRKSSQDPAAAPPHPSGEAGTRPDGESSGDGQAAEEPLSPLPPIDEPVRDRVAGQAEVPEDGEPGEAPTEEAAGEPDESADADPLAEDPKRRLRRQKQKEILKESEALMEQLLSLDFRRRKTGGPPDETASAESPLPDELPPADASLSGHESEDDAGMGTRTYRIGESSDAETAGFPARDDTAVFGETLREVASAAETSPHADPDLPDAALTGASSRDEREPLPESETAAPKPAWTRKPYSDVDGAEHEEPFASRPAHRLPKRSYANVIATLKIDIHTMATQLEDYRRQLSHNPPNEQQLIAWINALEDAIEEFSQVVDHLEEHQ